MVFSVVLDAEHSKWEWKERGDSSNVLDELNLSTEATPNAHRSGLGATKDAWVPALTYPSEIHTELLKKGWIEDPYKGFGEQSVQWIGDTEWVYRSTFSYSPAQEAGQPEHTHETLEFQGLDTLCDVYLNEHKILTAENQFRTWIVPVKSQLHPGQNTLLLHFKSAKVLALSLEKQLGAVRAGSTNLGHPSRVYVRKAQYDWRWDWGPELMTVGPFRPIILRTYALRITDLYARACLCQSGKDLVPHLNPDVTFSGDISIIRVITVQLIEKSTGKVILEKRRDSPAIKNGVSTFGELWKEREHPKQLKWWWPVGYGDQALYYVKVQVLGENDIILDEVLRTVGFRVIKLVQDPLVEPDQYGAGTTFLFEVNGVRMFMGGSNWIPADNLLTTVTEDRYRAWLQLLRDGNQNMVRLWGGGIYEPDVFYDICDELGLLVWQDFQFACGVYPAHDSFVESVRQEAIDNVTRLRSHPSLAIFCGNNEDYQMVLQWGDVPHLPAIKLYEEVLPETVASLTSGPAEIAYWRGSPYGGKGWDTADPTVGDIHQWNIWGGKEQLYQNYDSMGGRFVSEFGMPALPAMKTIHYWMDGADKRQWYAQSPLMAQHCRAGLFERRFSILMNENFRVTEDLETYAFNTQLMQAEAVGYAYRVWRRQWRGKGKEYNSGVIVWQLNDCWPVTSWAIVDYFLRPKPAYYVIARQLAPVTVNAQRTVFHNRPNDRPRCFYEFGANQSLSATIDFWGTNSTLLPVTVQVEMYAVDLNSSWTWRETLQDVILHPNQSTEIVSRPCPCPDKTQSDIVSSTGAQKEWTTSYSVVIGIRLLNAKTGDVMARFADWPQPYRYIDRDEVRNGSGLKVTVNGEYVKVECERPVKGLVLGIGEGDSSGDLPVKWSDNALDVMPGDPQVVTAKGLGGRNVIVTYFGKEAV